MLGLREEPGFAAQQPRFRVEGNWALCWAMLQGPQEPSLRPCCWILPYLGLELTLAPKPVLPAGGLSTLRSSGGLQDKPQPSSEWPGPPCLCPRQPPVRSAPQLRGPLSAPCYTSCSLCRDVSLLFSGAGDSDPPFASQSGQPSSLRKLPPFPRVFPERPWAPQGQEQVTFKVFGLRPEDLAG